MQREISSLFLCALSLSVCDSLKKFEFQLSFGHDRQETVLSSVICSLSFSVPNLQ
jgi:hypothetical protein